MHSTILRICFIATLVAAVTTSGCAPDREVERCRGAGCEEDRDTGSTQKDDAGCQGCLYGPDRRCVEGIFDDACGSGGEICSTCGAAETCNDQGECVTGSCSVQTCEGCCRAGVCRLGTKNFACGTGGEPCSTCRDSEKCTPDGQCVECEGCLDDDGFCKDGTTDEYCGETGASCTTCESNQTCRDGTCVDNEEESCSESCAGCCQDGKCRSGGNTQECGRDGSICKNCPAGFDCVSGSCSLQPGSRWTVIALDSTIVQSTVNPDSTSAPDPRLEVTVGETTGETSTLTDTWRPEWQERAVTESAANIKSNMNYTMWDNDRFDDDKIVSDCAPSFTDQDFTESSVDHTCIGGDDSGARATTRFRLEPTN